MGSLVQKVHPFVGFLVLQATLLLFLALASGFGLLRLATAFPGGSLPPFCRGGGLLLLVLLFLAPLLARATVRCLVAAIRIRRRRIYTPARAAMAGSALEPMWTRLSCLYY